MPTEEEGQQALQANDAANAELQRYIEHKDEVILLLRAGAQQGAMFGLSCRNLLRKVEGS